MSVATPLGTLIAVLWLVLLAAPGPVLLRRVAADLDPLERLAYGAPLGIVGGTLVLLAIAWRSGLTPLAILGVGGACGVATLALARWPGHSGLLAPQEHPRHGAWPGTLGLVVLLALAIRWIVFWSGALSTDDRGLWAGHVNLWGDWSLHLGDTTSFAWGDNFPPMHPRLAGHPFSYHYLSSLTTAAMVVLGMSPVAALPMHSWLLSVLTALAVFAFSRRLSGDRNAAALALLLFVLGGGLGWIEVVKDSLSGPSGLRALLEQPWDARAQQAANYRWLNVFFAYLAPQRSTLYGLPLAMLGLTLLLTGVRSRRWQHFAAAGVVAGLLPFANLGALLALALMTPFLALALPTRRWLVFALVWAVIAAPQLGLLSGGEPGALKGLRWQLGWIAAPDPWVWFWLKNLGAFLPLLALALADRRLLAPPAGRALWAVMPVFLIANVAVLQPWDWDNTKVLLYWYLATCVLVAALVAKLWKRHRSAPARLTLGLLVLSMLLSGALENWNQLRGRDRHLFLTTEELRLAAWTREHTEPHAVFAVGLQHNHPIPVLAGRRVLMSYPGWLWSQGADPAPYERDLRAIMTLAPEAERLMRRYRISYVVVGPNERARLDADPAAWRARYPAAVAIGGYEVFDVRIRAEGDR